MPYQARDTSYAPSLVYIVKKEADATSSLQQKITVEGVFPYYDDQIHVCDTVSFCLDTDQGWL